jgi:hypothetical protein
MVRIVQWRAWVLKFATCSDPNVLCETVDQALLRRVAARTEIDTMLNAPGEKREALA